MLERFGSILSKIDTDLNQINFNKSPNHLYQPISYTLSLGGKRIRPLLLYLGQRLFENNSHDPKNAALAIEIFHNFTLVHDDIMDKATTRRGQETVYRKWNDSIAILSGDVMLVKSYQLLATYPSEIYTRISHVFSDAAIKVCEGQQQDMDFETANNTSIQEYIEMITNKTAVLLGAGLKMGGILAGASPKDLNNLYQFGKNLGIAFQIQDDILDLFADEAKFGKKKGGDIIEGKKTFLVLKVYEIGNQSHKNKLQEIFKVSDENLKVKQAIELFEELEIKNHSMAESLKYHNISIDFLDKIEKMNAKVKADLLYLAEKLLIREI